MSSRFIPDFEKPLPELFGESWNSHERWFGSAGLSLPRLYLSRMALVLHLRLHPISVQPPDPKTLGERLRALALEAADHFRGERLVVPLVVLVEFQDARDQSASAYLSSWRQLSGDQDWLRGQLSLQILATTEHSSVADREARLGFLLHDGLPPLPPLSQLDNHTIARRLEEQLDALNQTALSGTREAELVEALVACLREDEPVQAFQSWCEQLERRLQPQEA